MKVATIILLTMLDDLSTIYLLRQPGYFEYNPTTVQIIEKFGLIPGMSLWWFLSTVFLIVIVVGLSYIHKWLARLALLLLGGPIFLAVLSNFAFIFDLDWFPYFLIKQLIGY